VFRLDLCKMLQRTPYEVFSYPWGYANLILKTTILDNYLIDGGYVVGLTHWPQFTGNRSDRFCGLVIRVPGHRSRGPCSIPGATRFPEK
jgi:hypothetical protein